MGSIVKVLKKFCHQNMLYWEKTGSDTYGRPVFADPVGLLVRWEDRAAEVVAPDGRLVFYKGSILLASPMLVGSWVFLGTLTDWMALPAYPNVPTVNQGGRELLQVNGTPDLKAQGFVYEAFI